MTTGRFIFRAYFVLGSLWLAWEFRDSQILSALFGLQARIALPRRLS